MSIKNRLKLDFGKAILGCFLVFMGLFASFSGSLITADSVYAVPSGNTGNTGNTGSTESGIRFEAGNNEENSTDDKQNSEDNTDKTEQKSSTSNDNCKKSLGPLGWLVCPTTGKIAEAVDWLYEKIENLLVINPIRAGDGSPIYEVWKYIKGIANIAFIVFLMIVIYSQITGAGISNYGIKKSLPKLIVAAILVNLSFLICSLAVDVSNVVGNGLRGFFSSVAESAVAGGSSEMQISYADVYSSLAGGTALGIGVGAIAFELGAIWMLIPTVLGALVAVASGLLTIALRQAVVTVLVMVSPLAMATFILPNTDNLFKKWRKLLTQMLVFYPMFSLLFGASNLAGFAIIANAKDGFTFLLGTAVQIFPLFFSWSLMKMSGTFLGGINARLQGLAARPLAANRAWAESHRQLSRQKHLASSRPITPSLRLMQFNANRRITREARIGEYDKVIQERGRAYRAMQNYKNGLPTKLGEDTYKKQAESLKYERVIKRDENTMNKGLSYLAKEGTVEHARLDKLDAEMVDEAVKLHTEKMRGEKIEYENARGLHRAMNNAIDAHMDNVNGYEFDGHGNKVRKPNYKFHFGVDDPEGLKALKRYDDLKEIMDGEVADVQYAAAGAAQGYNTKKKLHDATMKTYFDMTPASKDLDYRMSELVSKGNATEYIDAIIAGLRTINERGDTDKVKDHMNSVLNSMNGMQLGTHASQALASFLMFEVKDSDPILRRFGKYINIETAKVFEGERSVENITYDEYIKGYHDGEVDLISKDNPTGRMYSKRGLKELIAGTSLDNIERTALASLDDSLKTAYGFSKENKDSWEVVDYLKKREEIQKAFEPAFISASLKWASGSEQINSGIKFWTGYALEQKKDKDGNVILDDNEEPVYEMKAVWEDDKSGFKNHKDREEVEKYFRRKTNDYIKDQTTGQILSMRSDFRDPVIEHLLESYLDEESDGMTSDEKRSEYEQKVAEIQTRYGDWADQKKAKEQRDKDLVRLKKEFASRRFRKLLGESGKLKQMYRTRTSGTAINAKDWLREMVGLDNEDKMREEVAFYEERKRRERLESSGEDVDSYLSPGIYSEVDKEDFLNRMLNLRDRIIDDEPVLFFEETVSQLEEWFGEDSLIVHKYDDFFKKDHPTADNDELYEFLRELLGDLSNYPDA